MVRWTLKNWWNILGDQYHTALVHLMATWQEQKKAKGINHPLKSVNDAPVPSDAKTLLISCGAQSDAFAHKLQNRKIMSVAQGHVYLMENGDGITMKKTDSWAFLWPGRDRYQSWFVLCISKSMVMRQYVFAVQIIIFLSSSYNMLQSLTSESSLTLVPWTTENS